MSDLHPFSPWPKITRLSKQRFVITEKIDGTNACVVITKHPFGTHLDPVPSHIHTVFTDDDLDDAGMPNSEYLVSAQSRSRVLSPHEDNFGFATWVRENATLLVRALGEGYHFGEWAGPGIQKNPLDLARKTFFLFNTGRWRDRDNPEERAPSILEHFPEIDVVPILAQGAMQDLSAHIHSVLQDLRMNGSFVTPTDPDKSEGVVVFLPGSNVMFKILAHGDDQPKPSPSPEQNADDQLSLLDPTLYN